MGCEAGMDKGATEQSRRNHGENQEKKSGEGENPENGGVEEGSTFQPANFQFQLSTFQLWPVPCILPPRPKCFTQHFAAFHDTLMLYPQLTASGKARSHSAAAQWSRVA